jgi:hypothetical protein
MTKTKTTTSTVLVVDPRAARVLAAVRARGSDATTLRDAAHEASHALEFNIRKWDRTSIDRVVQRRKVSRADISSEVLARAVEQLVCKELGVDPDGDVMRWALVTSMEALKFDRISFEPDMFADLVRSAMKRRVAIEMAALVISLGA